MIIIKFFPKVIEEVKFNKNHPENNNVKLKNSKSKCGEVYTDNIWKKIDDNKLIEYLVKKGYQLYIKLSDIHKDQIIKRYVESNSFFKENIFNGNNNIKKNNPKYKENDLLEEIII